MISQVMDFLFYGQWLLFRGCISPWMNMSSFIGVFCGMIILNNSTIKSGIISVLLFFIPVFVLWLITSLFGDQIVRNGAKYNNAKKRMAVISAIAIDVLLFYHAVILA